MTEELKRLRGLKDLASKAVEEGARAVENVHLKTTGRTFAILKRIPVVAEPADLVEVIHDKIVSTNYGAVRAVTRGVSTALDALLDAADNKHEQSPPANGEPKP